MKHGMTTVLAAVLISACNTAKVKSSEDSSLEASHHGSSQHGTGLNRYCDPIGTMYMGGTPLFNESTGVSLTLTQFLSGKRLNQYCDPIGTNYLGGTPLFNESTGVSMTLDSYLSTKQWVRGVNRYCDPAGTVYAGGTPLFNESTGTSMTLDQYLNS